MDAASSFAFLKKKPQRFAGANDLLGGIGGYQPQEVDTNVICVKFDSLKQAEENLQMGDAYFCKHCRSCLSSTSQIYAKPDYEVKFVNIEKMEEEKPKDDKEEEKKGEDVPAQKDKIITTAIADTDKVWVCEFCGTHNLLNLDLEEVPKSNDVIYLLKSAEQMNKHAADLNSDISTIFCIDNSGSMSVSQEIKGKHDLKHGLSQEEYEMLKQFIEYGADQYLPNQKKDTTFITRKQCVLAAIEDQLLEMKTEFPNRKVGLVTFNTDVTVIGDGKNIPETIAGDKLYKYDVLQQIGEGNGDKFVSATVKDSAESLIKKFEGLKETGKTALGPALLISLGLASKGKQGSRVIICTDGLANIGLGEMDTPEGLAKADEFYTTLGNLAKEKGISISVISIKGEGCKLDIIGKLADLTTGSLMRVDPNDITSKFGNMMKEEVIGTQVEVKLRLHQGLKFRNESEEFLKERACLFEKTVGNVTAKTEMTFEYEMRADEELMEFGVDMTKLETVPFQAQIIYHSINGDKMMRVITKKLKITQNLEEAEKHMNVNIMATRALQHQAQHAYEGRYDESEQVGQAWGQYFGGHVAQNRAMKSEFLDNYQGMNAQLQGVAMKKKAKAMKSVPMAQPQYHPPPPQAGGLFGGAPKSQPQSGGSLFGSAPMSQPQSYLLGGGPSQPQSGGSLFGSAPMSQPQSSLLGGGPSQPQPQKSASGGGGLFSGLTGFFGKKEVANQYNAPPQMASQQAFSGGMNEQEAEEDDEDYEVMHVAKNFNSKFKK